LVNLPPPRYGPQVAGSFTDEVPPTPGRSPLCRLPRRSLVCPDSYAYMRLLHHFPQHGGRLAPRGFSWLTCLFLVTELEKLFLLQTKYHRHLCALFFADCLAGPWFVLDRTRTCFCNAASHSKAAGSFHARYEGLMRLGARDVGFVVSTPLQLDSSAFAEGMSLPLQLRIFSPGRKHASMGFIAEDPKWHCA
jgi:hypothetical protein